MDHEPLPSAGHAEVRIVAATPEAARRVAEVLRRCFASTEQRSYPAGSEGATRLSLTVDTAHAAEPAQSWLASSRSPFDDHVQADVVSSGGERELGSPPGAGARPADGGRGAAATATLRERRTHRQEVLKALYEAVGHHRREVGADALRERLRLPDEDLSAACAYLAGEGLITVDWTSHETPATASLTHEGIRFMEEAEERG